MPSPRILVVKLGALGDVLLALPALRLLRRSLPQAHLAWLVERRNQPALDRNPDLDEVHVAEADLWRRRPLDPATWSAGATLIRRLRAARFDLALDLQGLFKSALWARLSGAGERIGLPAPRTRERWSHLFLTGRAVEPAARHVVDLYLAAAAEAIRNLGQEPEPAEEDGLLVLSAAEQAWAEQAQAEHGLADFVILNPGAAWTTKRWPVERFGELAGRIAESFGVSVFVAFGAGEEALARAVVERAGKPGVVAFPTDIRQLAALSRRARVFVAGDTGPYHLARLVGTPTVALFGPTDPALNGPRSERDAVLWGKVACSPCYRRTCPTAIECMASIGVDQVLSQVGERLRSGPVP